jgi:hypothetical protein
VRRLALVALVLLTACAGGGVAHNGPRLSPTASAATSSPRATSPARPAKRPTTTTTATYLLYPTLPPKSVPGALNPDVTRATIGSTICATGWTATIRPPATYTDNLKALQMAALGFFPTATAKQLEEDHRVPLELGGAPKDPANLWPEPWDGPMGARVKDLLENKVRRDVCTHALTLEQGQAVFLGDWWTAVIP